MPEIPDRSIRICADRGGTFYRIPGINQAKGKNWWSNLSQDPSNYRDAPTEGIRRVLEKVLGKSLPRGEKLNTDKIDFIRLSTTVATNALLERKGQKHALVITKGFKDLLTIGNQSRPRIFDLNIRRPTPLFTDVLEVDERVTIVGYTSDPKAAEHAIKFDDNGNIAKGYTGLGKDEGGQADGPGEIVRGLSGENKIKSDLQKLREQGYTSLAICLVHSYTYPEHELIVGKIASSLGFSHISISSQLMPMIKMVPRGMSATADAYLTPILYQYLDGFFSGFDEQLKSGGVGKPRVEFMASDGGLLDLDNFSGLKSILSGPAGGVVGYALTSWDENERTPIIGLDVGGTSTDVSRFDGRYETVYETTTAGVTIQSPQLDINTVAAGGGSCLTFQNGLFLAGPQSAGAEPGPACYRKGGPLAVTDANLMLGRLIPDLFPKIFGKSENEPLDMEASKSAFEKVAKEVRSSADKDYTLDEPCELWWCRRPARMRHCTTVGHPSYLNSQTQLYPFATLSDFHRAYERQEPSSENWSEESKPRLLARLDALTEEVKSSLEKQGFKGDRVRVKRLLNMRFDGTDTSLMVLEPEDGSHDFEGTFKRAYKQEFGFLLETKNIIIDDIKDRTHSVYFEGPGRIDTPVFLLEKLEVGDVVSGPAMIIDNTQTIVLNPHSKTTVTRNHLFISLEDE
ncbi:5-oxoprolinase [Rhizoctonia solani AG-1 IA]|uniref:5-oxoprolinase n=1 Tax=Thanatephorus cucumeris (strain AG1-IA) TaxID=983506 RepID=L8WX13_THACA|nr:5-oxoprolinase [Rhizoctonia solani AG-1 IA]